MYVIHGDKILADNNIWSLGGAVWGDSVVNGRLVIQQLDLLRCHDPRHWLRDTSYRNGGT